MITSVLTMRHSRWMLMAAGMLAGCDGGRSPVSPAEAEQPARLAATGRGDAATPRGDLVQSIEWPDATPLPNVPSWAADAVFYQIFPERFRNGDPANDPTRESLESPDDVPASWAISPWTGDWYARAAWERELGDNFYEHGVFNRRYGGDLQGVLDKLDYLAELGVTALYFNPVFYGRSLHKYDGASMHHVDPYFGPDPEGDFELMASETSDPETWHWTAADKLFLELIEQARARGMRVVIDGVFNHTGRDFFAFADLRKNQAASPYKDWYIVAHFDDPATPQNEFQYKSWWGFESLPEFSDNADGDDLHAGPRQYLFDITRRWMDPDGDGDPRDGIDGWRLDVANEVPRKFWHEWNGLVRELNPAAYTVAEVWNDAREFLVGGGFSATMNYHAFAFPTKGYLVDGRLTPHDFGRELDLRRQLYPAAMQFALQNLVDSHDTDRLASMIVNRPVDGPYEQADRFDYDVSSRATPRHHKDYQVRRPNDEDRRLQRMIVLLQMAYLGAPMIYYGDEAGMWGGDDPCDRMPMTWDDMEFEPQASDPLGRPRQPDSVAFDRELHDFYRDAIGVRREREALRHGSFATEAVDDNAKFYALKRELGGQRVYAAFNRGGEAFVWELPATNLRVALASADGVELAGDGARLTLPPLSAAVLTEP